MSEGRISTISKPAGRRASDAGRSRLADLTRPIARDRRITKRRRPAIIASTVALIVAAAIGAALFGLPVRTWFGQDDQLRQLDTELSELQAVNADLQNEVQRLQTPRGHRRSGPDQPRPGRGRRGSPDGPRTTRAADRPPGRLAVRTRGADDRAAGRGSVSERSERTIITVFIAAGRRCAHWCPVGIELAEPPHTSMAHG